MVRETYEAGAAAYRAGTPETANPYPYPTSDYYLWQRGFLEARAEFLQAQRGGDEK